MWKEGAHVTLWGKIMAMNPCRYVERDDQQGWCWRFSASNYVSCWPKFAVMSCKHNRIWGNTVSTSCWFYSPRNPTHLRGIHFSMYHTWNPYQIQKLNQLWCGAKHLILDIIGNTNGYYFVVNYEHHWMSRERGRGIKLYFPRGKIILDTSF